MEANLAEGKASQDNSERHFTFKVQNLQSQRKGI